MDNYEFSIHGQPLTVCQVQAPTEWEVISQSSANRNPAEVWLYTIDTPSLPLCSLFALGG